MSGIRGVLRWELEDAHSAYGHLIAIEHPIEAVRSWLLRSVLRANLHQGLAAGRDGRYQQVSDERKRDAAKRIGEALLSS